MSSPDLKTQAVERWGDLVWRLALVRTANVHDAQDVFQEVFLRYFRQEDRQGRAPASRAQYSD